MNGKMAKRFRTIGRMFATMSADDAKAELVRVHKRDVIVGLNPDGTEQKMLRVVPQYYHNPRTARAITQMAKRRFKELRKVDARLPRNVKPAGALVLCSLLARQDRETLAGAK